MMVIVCMFPFFGGAPISQAYFTLVSTAVIVNHGVSKFVLALDSWKVSKHNVFEILSVE